MPCGHTRPQFAITGKARDTRIDDDSQIQVKTRDPAHSSLHIPGCQTSAIYQGNCILNIVDHV